MWTETEFDKYLFDVQNSVKGKRMKNCAYTIRFHIECILCVKRNAYCTRNSTMSKASQFCRPKPRLKMWLNLNERKNEHSRLLSPAIGGVDTKQQQKKIKMKTNKQTNQHGCAQ